MGNTYQQNFGQMIIPIRVLEDKKSIHCDTILFSLFEYDLNELLRSLNLFGKSIDEYFF